MKIRALTLLLVAFPSLAVAQRGTAYFSSPINWSQTPALYFTVVGGQPDTCGDLYTTRNGQPLYSPGWICTDSNGDATMGPWTWANTPGDQTDTDIEIGWPDDTVTIANSDHVWDKTCPTISPTPFGSGVPSAFTGSASDNQWGAGFDDGWTTVTATYEDTTTHLFWSRATGAYNASYDEIPGEISAMPSHSINWTFDPLRNEAPSSGAHTPGHSYLWRIYMTDGDVNCYALSAASGFTD